MAYATPTTKAEMYEILNEIYIDYRIRKEPFEALELEKNPNLCIDGMIRSIGRDGRPLPRFRFSMAAEGSEQREGTSGPWVQEIL